MKNIIHDTLFMACKLLINKGIIDEVEYNDIIKNGEVEDLYELLESKMERDIK